MTTQTALISPEELSMILDRPDVKILDASYGLPDIPVRIGAALPFDIDDVADPAAALPHTLPTPALFAEKAGALGISNDDTVIVYDRNGIHMAAARAWWMFRVFGHRHIRILDGGLPAWVAAQLPVMPAPDRPETPARAVYKAAYRPELVKLQDEILANISTGSFTLLDARDARRYSGDAAEPRPGMESGHIPGAYSQPFAELVDPETGALKPREVLADILARHKIDPARPVACTCGSGVTACVVALALHETGHPDAAVYDGSWTEWGSAAGLPKKKGDQP